MEIHVLRMNYVNSCSGAMLVICDVNEYRKCVKDFQIPLVTRLFNTLHALCNLLVVVPENLKQVCCGEELVRAYFYLEFPKYFCDCDVGFCKMTFSSAALGLIQLQNDFKSIHLNLVCNI